MYKTKLYIFIFLSTLLLTLSCSSNKIVTRGLNNQYPNINVKNVCNCSIDEVARKDGRYMPPVSLRLKYEKFNNASNWTFENDFKKIYFINLYNSKMTLISKEPVIVTHKNKALTLNFTPCTFKDEYYKIPTFLINITRRDRRDLNKDFDYSAFAYFDYLTSGTNMREGKKPNIVLKEILEEQFFYDDDNSNDFKLFIRNVNMEYKTNVKEYEVLYNENGINIVDEFINELGNSQIDISDFIVNEFVLTEKTNHRIRINNEEKRRLKRIFSIYDDLTFKQIDFKLKNQPYNGYLSGENNRDYKIAIEINTNIIRKWNKTTGKPELDSDSKDVIADILVHTDGFSFSNYNTDEIKVDSLCTSTSEITNTGILLEFDKAKLVFPQKEITYNYRNLPLDVKNYPFFKIINKNKKRNNSDITKSHDPLLTNFTGLMIPNSNVQLPIDNVLLTVKGKNIIINNFFISGIFEIKKQSKNDLSNQLKLSTTKSPIKISTDDLISHLKNIGMEQVEIKTNEDSITVFFKKELKK